MIIMICINHTVSDTCPERNGVDVIRSSDIVQGSSGGVSRGQLIGEVLNHLVDLLITEERS